MTVLIAEDEAASRRVLEKAVRSFGHEVSAAADGEQAWELFQKGDFGFVLTDWMMPGMDGLELCRRIRGWGGPDYVYVTIITSMSAQEDLITGMDAGADDFLVKPIDRRELRVKMRAAERILSLQKELREKNEQLEVVNARLRRLSRLDALMQIGNRLAFDERIAAFHDRAIRYHQPYCVIMCDVDHFKSYNDTCGHLAGDEALRRIAGAVNGCLRTSDGAFRYGGEEIVVLLAERTLSEGVWIAERLRSTVESLGLVRRDDSAGHRVTISCGVAACPAGGGGVDDWEVVVRWADEALYRAKALGRNRVEAAEVRRPALAH